MEMMGAGSGGAPVRRRSRSAAGGFASRGKKKARIGEGGRLRRRRSAVPRGARPQSGKPRLQETQEALLALGRDRERDRAELLSGLQGRQVGAFLVEVGEGELVGARLQADDVVLGELQPD